MALQGRTWESNVRLSLSGVPVTGIVAADVTVRYRRVGDTTLQVKPITTLNWIPVSNGLYTLKWAVGDMSTIGPFYFEVTGAGFNPHISEFDVTPTPITSLVSPGVCIVSGNVANLEAMPSSQQAIIMRLAKSPAVVSSAFILGDGIRTLTDAYGNFSVAIARGVKVIVEIERTGIKQQITIPNQETANLIDLLPPITNII